MVGPPHPKWCGGRRWGRHPAGAVGKTEPSEEKKTLMISKKLVEDMKLAMKAGDRAKLGVIRMLRAELKNAEIAVGDGLSEDQEQKVLISYAKKRKEAAQQYADAGRQDLADKENSEREITMSYLPAQLDDAELESLIREKIEETGAVDGKDFGAVMKAVMQAVGGRAEGSTVSGLVKKVLGR